MPPLTEWVCLGYRDVIFFYAKLCKAFQRGPQMDLPDQGDVASSGLSLCTTPVTRILLSQVHAAGRQVPHPVPTP